MKREQRVLAATVNMITESQRAIVKHGPENTIDAPGKTDGDRLAILMEEVGEVAHELTYDAGKGDMSLYPEQAAQQRLRKELVQVGAMAATWIAYIDQQKET